MSIKLEVHEHSGQVIAVFFICVILLQIICSKAKRADDSTTTDVLNKVGYKIEELELRVHLLTYKMQYGTWPLPHQVNKSKFRKNMRNLRLTLSNPSERNEWIKRVLLSPTRNNSYSKYSYASKQHLTELFSARKKFYPYFPRDNLSLEYSSISSKSSSEKSARLNSTFRKTIGQRQHKFSKHENLDLQNRNAKSLPQFSRRRNSRFPSKRSRDKCHRKETDACKKFMKSMADCKQYLKELHHSSKNLGLICSTTSEMSDGFSIKNSWSESQDEKDDHEGLPHNFNEKFGGNQFDKPAKEVNTDTETSVEEMEQQNKENRLELANTIYPVLNVVDKNLLPSKMNITFRANMFPRQSVSNMLIKSPREKKRLVQSSEEALYQVKKKLESLHNVLRTYESRNFEARMTGKQDENKMDIRQNVMNTSEINFNEKKKSRVSFNTIHTEEFLEETVYESSEQYDSDDTCRTSETSVQQYFSTFSTHCLDNEVHFMQPTNNDNGIYFLNNQDSNEINNNEIIRSSAIICDPIPERVYYTISSNLFGNKINNKETPAIINSITSNIYAGNNQAKLLQNQQVVPMETDEDLLVISPTSSRTEVSKDSESDKSTGLLLQEALQFKRALLTRIELENICHAHGESVNSQTISEYSKYSYINNNLQSKLLDIIAEEQSVSSSTEKTSRTCLFLNIKQDKQLAHLSTFNNNVTGVQQNEIKDTSKNYLDSKDNLESTSEYFSLSNTTQEKSSMNSNQLSLSKHGCLNDSTKMILNNLDTKNLNYSTGNIDENRAEIRFTNYLKNVEREYSEKSFPHVNNINEFINPSSESVELFSQNLDETFDGEQNTSINEKYKEGTSLYDEKYTEDNDISLLSQNLALKRHPGTCSLIEATDIEKTELSSLIESTDIYDFSGSDSKDNSLETNLIQDSLTSSANHSNNSNILEPSSVTMLTSRLGDEEENDLNWSNIKSDDYSDDCIHENKTQTFSTDTIILRKYDSIDAKNYRKPKQTSNEHTSLIKECENGRQEKVHLSTKSSFTELVNETVYKSYSNLVSPHSSLYFTDEASSSATKLNNKHSKNFEDLQSKGDNKSCYQEVDFENIKPVSTSSPDESKNISTKTILNIQKSETEDSDNQLRAERESQNSNKSPNNENDPVSKNYAENIDKFSSKEMKEILYNNHNSNFNLHASKNTNNQKTRSNLLVCKIESLNVNKNLSRTSRQRSPGNVKENITVRRINKALKSKSQENALKSEKLTKLNTVMKEFKSDIIQNRKESTTPTHTKVRNSSVETRRTTNHESKIDKKRSRSQVNFRTNESLKATTSQSLELPFNRNSRISDSKLKSSSPVKQQLFVMPRTSSKSCIPILKSRLEAAARQSENEGRPKSPVRGPLTMTMFCRENLSNRKPESMEGNIQLEGKLEGNLGVNIQCMEEKNIYMKTDDDQNQCQKNDLTKSSCVLQSLYENTENAIRQEPVVIYVNVFTKYDHNTTKIVDPKKFLEYIKNRKLDVQKVIEERQSNHKDEALMASADEKNNMHKIVTIVSSIMNGNELSGESTDLPISKTNSKSLINNLSSDTLKQLCFLSVEQREIDVTAKPSVIDTSTSISDLENISGTSRSATRKFQICGTPKELNNDEYVALLEILYEEANIAHLQELQNVCKRIVSSKI